MNLKFYKIAVLNDILGLELTGYDIQNIVNPEGKSKMRNLKKSTDTMTKFVDKVFEEENVQEAFGDLCDSISEKIDEILKQIAK